MRLRTIMLLGTAALLFSANAASAEFYRWVDKDGKEFFTNEPTSIPQEYRSTSTPVKTDNTRVSVGAKPAAAGKPAAPLAEHHDRNGRGEEWWHRRAVHLRQQLNDLQDEYNLIQKKDKDDEEKPRKLTTKTGKSKSKSAREKKKEKLEKQIVIAKRRLEVDLPEEARKADAYPGWIRE